MIRLEQSQTLCLQADRAKQVYITYETALQTNAGLAWLMRSTSSYAQLIASVRFDPFSRLSYVGRICKGHAIDGHLERSCVMMTARRN